MAYWFPVSLLVFNDVGHDKINSPHSIPEKYRVFTLLMLVNLVGDGERR